MTVTEDSLKRVFHFMYGYGGKESTTFKRLLQEATGIIFMVSSRVAEDAVKNAIRSMFDADAKGASIHVIALSKNVELLTTSPTLTPMVKAVRESNKLFNLYTELSELALKSHRKP
jgi:predicted helicase